MSEKSNPKRLKRSESYLGIHFDFHADDDCNEIGKNTTDQMVQHIIDQVKPDYIQCDCKGHRGLSSYPTKVGNQAPGFVGDPLRIWREVTAKNGVSLYMHFSGVWDTEALKKHPEWARIDENGEADNDNTSVFGPYVDELLIPQLKELCDVYQVDGVWVDGECWATCQDYHENVIKAFRDKTGIQEIPKTPDQPYFFEYTEFCREGFRKYLKHYVDTMHEHNKDFQIASNWAYTTFMPEEPNIDVDFISGDYPLQDSVNAARLEGRYMARQRIPWDLMAWSFSSKWGEPCRSTKSVKQLQQEAAIVLALGGGFQAYFKQKRDGSINQWEMKLMREVAEFCRQRQQFCHNAEAVPQIALLLLKDAFYRKTKRVFSPWDGELVPISGILRGLLDGQNSVEVLGEHHLKESMEEYPLIVLPEWEYIDPDFRQQLLDYTTGGGNLLVLGARASLLFKNELGIDFIGDEITEQKQWLEHEGWLAGILAPSLPVNLKEGTRPFGKLYDQDDVIGSYHSAASIRQYGQGKIAAVYFDFGERYCNGKTTVARDFINGLARELFPRPLVAVTGSHNIDVCVNRINGKLAVNLVNTSGPHANKDVYVYDEIPPIGPVEIIVRDVSHANRVTIQPGGHTVEFQRQNDEISFVLPKLDIHQVIILD